jgi:hypothetical protein
VRLLRRVPWLATAVLLLAAAILVPHLGSGLLADTNLPARPIRSAPTIEPTFAVRAGIDGEIFPALANYASLQRADDRDFGTFTVTVSNSSSVLSARISLEVRGWSDVELQNVSLGAGEVRKLLFAPVFWPRLYANHEIAPATAIVKVTDFGNRLLHEETVPVRMRSVDDMYWGQGFKFAAFIASWVTPHDPAVESVLARAKEFMPGRRLPGYEEWKSPEQQKQMTREEARAIYGALQKSGVSYVKSSLTFGKNTNVSERVRMPGESLHQLSANCIDGVVMYASLFENLNMDAVVVLVPGHAYVGVRESADSNSYLYLETAITGRAPFDTAVKAASRGIAKVAVKDVIRIPVSEARTAGIYPMPLPGQDLRHFPAAAPSAEANSPGR